MTIQTPVPTIWNLYDNLKIQLGQERAFCGIPLSNLNQLANEVHPGAFCLLDPVGYLEFYAVFEEGAVRCTTLLEVTLHGELKCLGSRTASPLAQPAIEFANRANEMFAFTWEGEDVENVILDRLSAGKLDGIVGSDVVSICGNKKELIRSQIIRGIPQVLQIPVDANGKELSDEQTIITEFTTDADKIGFIRNNGHGIKDDEIQAYVSRYQKPRHRNKL